jgi:uncharacterized protein (DUF433 family)
MAIRSKIQHPLRASKVKRKAATARRIGKRVELGDYVVADPEICHGKPTYKGTRIMVWQILQDLARGETVDEVVRAWGGRVSREAVLETIRLAGGALLDSDGRLSRRPNGRLAA